MNLRNLVRPIRVRLTLWYVLLLAVMLGLFGGTLYVALLRTLYDNLDDVLINGATLAVSTLQVDALENLSAGAEQSLAWSDSKRGEHLWRVIDPSGQIVAHAGMQDLGDLPVEPAAIAQALAGREVFQAVRVGHEPVRVYSAPAIYQGEIVGVVQEALSMDDTQQILTAFRWVLLLALPATLALASGGGLFLADRALRPVDQITHAAKSISARDLSQRLNLDLPDDELGRLARTFDAMIARLDQAFSRQRRFTADASHELRTPLTIMKGNLGLALAHPRNVDYYHRVLVEVNDKVNQMSRLVDRLLALARSDAEGVSLHRQTVNLSNLLTDLIEQTQPMAADKGLELTVQIAPDLVASVDPDSITQAMLNLLDNAIKYTTTPGRVRVDAHYDPAGGGEIRISISDSGSGISNEHLPHIFDRFHRVDRARRREGGGAGLGLSIAREMVRAHGGDLTVHSVSGEGSTFTVHLPLE